MSHFLSVQTLTLFCSQWLDSLHNLRALYNFRTKNMLKRDRNYKMQSFFSLSLSTILLTKCTQCNEIYIWIHVCRICFCLYVVSWTVVRVNLFSEWITHNKWTHKRMAISFIGRYLYVKRWNSIVHFRVHTRHTCSHSRLLRRMDRTERMNDADKTTKCTLCRPIRFRGCFSLCCASI